MVWSERWVLTYYCCVSLGYNLAVVVFFDSLSSSLFTDVNILSCILALVSKVMEAELNE